MDSNHYVWRFIYKISYFGRLKYIYRNLFSLAIKFQMHFIDILIYHTCTHTLTFSPFAMFSYMDVVDSGGVDQFSWNPCKSFSEGSCTNAAVSDQLPPNSTPPHPSLNLSDNPHPISRLSRFSLPHFRGEIYTFVRYI